MDRDRKLRGNFVWALPASFDEATKQCGTSAFSNYRTANELRIEKSEVGKYPWHVAIYSTVQDEQPRFVCGGTLIASNVVLTAAFCVYNSIARELYKPILFKVVAGKFNMDYKVYQDIDQRKEVSEILTRSYKGEIADYSRNIAILILKNEFMFNTYVQPACLGKLRISPSMSKYIGTIVGWSMKKSSANNAGLEEANLEYIDVASCLNKFRDYRRFVSYDKFCLSTQSVGSNTMTGSGYVIRDNGKFYVAGVLSANLRTSEFIPVTNVTKHYEWIKTSLTNYYEKQKCPDGGFKCGDGTCIKGEQKCDTIPDCADGSDETQEACSDVVLRPSFRASCDLPSEFGIDRFVRDKCTSSQCEINPGSKVSIGTVARPVCKKGYGKTKDVFRGIACLGPNTLFPTATVCIKLCPPLKSLTLSMTCTFEGDTVDCSDFMMPQTKVKYRCKELYEPKFPNLFNGEDFCLQGGRWESRLPVCVPVCGRPNNFNAAQLTISGGKIISITKHPWHAGVYDCSGRNSCNQICGASIISPNLMLTAAHCIYDDLRGTNHPPSRYRVAAGKTRRSWEAAEGDEQKSDVRNIIYNRIYRGKSNSYQYDIALLELSTPLVFNDLVLPVCLDKTGHGFRSVHEGTAVGWGLTEEDKYSEELKEVDMDIIDTVTCQEDYKFFTQFISPDKFCTRYRGGAGAQQGDSGGGFYVSRSEYYYVAGVVSLKPKERNLFGVFTNVSHHIEWIKKEMQESEKRMIELWEDDIK